MQRGSTMRDRHHMGVERRSDGEILELITARDPEGIAQLYDRYGRLAFTLAFRVLNDQGAAEDVVQEALVSVWRRGSTYRADRGSLRTWVCSIVHHRALDRLRGRSGKARQEVSIDASVHDTPFEDTWDQVTQSLERDQIGRALAALPFEQRQAIELAYLDGYSQSEISERLKIPLGTVKGRTRTALKKLRTSLEIRGLVVQ